VEATSGTSYQQEREERRGLEQRAATLIASMLVTIGLAASGGSSVVARGSIPKWCLVAAVAVLAVAIVFLAYSLMRPARGQGPPTAESVAAANIDILARIRMGTLLLAVGVLLAAVALIGAFLGARPPALGSTERPVEVHATR
jgi:hypothetical protein